VRFDGTTRSLDIPIAQQPVAPDDPIAALLIAYEHQQNRGVSAPTLSLLDQATRLVEERLREQDLDTALLCLAEAVYRHRAEPEPLIAVLARYLAAARPPADEAWARWHLVDNLALLRRCTEMITAQQRLVQWAEPMFGVASCLWVMNDGTQARCWVTTGQAAHWLALFEDLMARAEATAHNRLDRFYYLRTAASVRIQDGHHAAVTPLIQRIHALAEEDTMWEDAGMVRCEAAVLTLSLLSASGSDAALRHVAAEASAHLAAYEARYPLENDDHRRRVQTLYHNTAAVLYRATQYDVAIPLFRRAIALGLSFPHTYVWLAAALWATTHDRTTVLPLLREAALRDVRGTRWYRHLPEFRAVADDPAFERAAAAPFIIADGTVAV